MTKVQGFVACVLLFFCAGCGTGLVPVQGEVLLDGQPLQSAQIMFVPKSGRPATGKSDANGKFRLTTNKPDDGVAAGAYTVTVTAHEVKYEPKPGTEAGFVEKLIWKAPEKYSKPAESGLTATVAAAQPVVKLELNSTP